MLKLVKSMRMPYSVFVICMDYLFVYLGYYAILPILAILLTQKQYTVDQVALAASVFMVALKSGRFF